MKKISKMMLAAVASVALAAPAFAWDFSASGSASAAFNITTTKADKDTDAVGSGGVSSDVGAITLSSTNADGANTSTLSYAVDWADSGLDETLSISGSRKVGDWTGSAGASYNLDRYGCSNTTDNLSRCGQSGADTTGLTLTDGTMTIVLGDASHLSSQNVGSGSNAGGAVGFSGDDDAIGARVGGYNGVSLGYAISDTMSVAVAYQASGDVADACGSGDAVQDGETAYHGIGGTGFSFNGTFGTIGVGATICNAATESKVSTLSTSTATSTMGVGVSMDFGDIDPWISFGTYSSIGTVSKAGVAYVGTDIGLTYALGSDSVVFSSTSSTEISTASGGTAGEAQAKSGMELGYSAAVGPMGLAIGYGSTTKDQKGGVEGYSYSDIEVEMSISF